MDPFFSKTYLTELARNLENRPSEPGTARPSKRRPFRERRDAGRQLARP